MKRFWTEVTLCDEGDGFGVLLDAMPLRTPGRAPLILPTQSLAEAVAEEWRAQGARVDPAAMPLTRTANTAIDRVAPMRAEVARRVAAYGASDLLCYRADRPEALVARQRAWDAPLDWAAEELGARLKVTAGVMPVAQAQAALDALDRRVGALTPFQLTPFHDLVALTGSLILGLAVIEDALSAEAAWSLSRIDEAFQAEQWGEDAEAAADAEARRRDFLAAHRAWRLLRG